MRGGNDCHLCPHVLETSFSEGVGEQKRTGGGEGEGLVSGLKSL